MAEFTAREKSAEAKREVSYRRSVYARLVNAAKMSQARADQRIAIMEEIMTDYEKIAGSEEAKGRLL